MQGSGTDLYGCTVTKALLKALIVVKNELFQLLNELVAVDVVGREAMLCRYKAQGGGQMGLVAARETVLQYADGVFMPTKEATSSENTQSSYRMFLDKNILPVLGDTLLTDIIPAMISKLLVDFQVV